MSVFDRATAVPVVALVALTFSTTCAQAPDSEDPPDVAPLLAVYQDPSGTVDSSRPVSWIGAAQAQVELVARGNADVVVSRIVEAAFASAASMPTGQGGKVPVRLNGTVKFQVPCGPKEDENADVAVSIDDGVIAPVLWGTAHACPLSSIKGVPMRYDGAFTIYRYPGADLLVRVDGRIADVDVPIKLDFKVTEGLVETRVPTSTGDVIVRPGGTDVLARAANGLFRCDAADHTCK
jgi:hypothetical protein